MSDKLLSAVATFIGGVAVGSAIGNYWNNAVVGAIVGAAGSILLSAYTWNKP